MEVSKKQENKKSGELFEAHETPSRHNNVASLELLGQRAEQQDASQWAEYEQPNGPRLVLAVADGHSEKGEKAAKYAAERITHELGSEPKLDAPRIHEAFLLLHDAISKELPGAGTTLTVAIREGNKLTAAYVGDSEAWLFKNGELRQRTIPHLYSQNAEEKQRLERGPAIISRRGQIVANIPGEDNPHGIMVTRSLGDEAYGPYVLHEPKVETITLDGQEKFLLVGSDGFWDATTHSGKSLHALEHVLETATSAEEAREQIMDILQRRILNDNATMLIAKL